MAQEKHTSKSGPMTTAEAGKMGGERTAETHGKEFYQEIGKKGGEAEHECRGRECTHPSHQSGSHSESTSEKRSEAGRKGAESPSHEAKVKGGDHSHKGR